MRLNRLPDWTIQREFRRSIGDVSACVTVTQRFLCNDYAVRFERGPANLTIAIPAADMHGSVAALRLNFINRVVELFREAESERALSLPAGVPGHLPMVPSEVIQELHHA